MSGHSKWSTIKHKKAARDHVRGNVFTKMANAIAVAVKKGGGVGDPDMNFSLRLAVEKAKAVNMPVLNIKRAIERGAGKGGAVQLAEMTIECFGPEGESIVVEAVTDNNNRTIATIRTVVEKNGGIMGIPGSVMYLFDKVSMIEVEGAISEELQLELIDAGAVDFDVHQEGSVIYGGFTQSKQISDKLREVAVKIVDIGIVYIPKVINNAIDMEKTEAFLDLIRELDDVQEVFTNVV